MTNVPIRRHTHRRIIWPVIVVLTAVALTLSARWGLYLYRYYVVDCACRKSGLGMISVPIGPHWLHKRLGSFSQWILWKPVGARLAFKSSRNSRAEIEWVLWCLSGLDSIEIVELIGDGVTDADVRRLRNLPLDVLDLTETRVTSDGLDVLSELPHLRQLELCSSLLIDDAALIQVARAPQLERLCLDGTAVTDAGLAQLSSLKELYLLSFNNTAITDDGLLHLRGLKKLSALSISNTSVTDAGVDALRNKLPDLELTDD